MILDVRLQFAHRPVDCLGLDVVGDELLRLARRWLACHGAIGVLLNFSEPPHVAQVPARLGGRQEVEDGD